MIQVFQSFRRRFSSQKTLIGFSGAASINSLTGLIAGFAILRWVLPGELGVWQSLLILDSYVGFLQIGVVHGLNRELPFRVGAGLSSGRDLAATAQTVSVLAALALVVLGLCSFFVSSNPLIRFALPVVFLNSAAGIYNNYLSVTFRADQAFDKLASIYLLMAVVNIASLPLVYFLGYYGIPLRTLAIALIQISLIHIFRPLRVPLSFSLSDLTSLLRTGLPIFVFGYLGQIAKTAPRTILLLVSGPEMVGLFSPAAAVLGLVGIIPGSIGQYVYAKMSFRLGRTNCPRSLWSYAWKSSLGSLVVTVVVAGVASLTFPWVVERLFPKYSASVPAVFWAALAAAFLSSQLFYAALTSLKAWSWLATYTIMTIGLSFVAPYALYCVLPTSPLISVTAGYAFAGVCTFVVGLVLTFRATRSSGEWAC